MKKNVLALSITAAVMSLGIATGANAITVNRAGAVADTLALNGDGIGHILVVPYYTAQAENSTLINLVNTDTTNAKAVKVRFRGAANSDDVLDFQVFLSPGDVWTANISKGADGNAVLTTNDTTCLRPDRAAVGTTTKFPFSTARLDPSLTGDAKANGTREGYVEIFNMADIPPKAAWPFGAVAGTASTGDIKSAGIATSATSTANPLFTDVKHVAKVAPCGAVVQALDQLDPTYGDVQAVATTALVDVKSARANGMVPPTSGLMANWTIINVVGAAAWSGNAVAIEAQKDLAKAAANITYFPQTGTPTGNATAATVDFFTADPLLQKAAFRSDNLGQLAALTAPAFRANQQDLPDLSTPYIVAAADTTAPKTQALALSKSLTAKAATNEFLTDATITAATDWVFSLPTRRYSVALNYGKIGASAGAGLTDTGIRFTNLSALSETDYKADATYADTTYANAGYFTKLNASTVLTSALGGRQICVNGISIAATDREESATKTTASLSPVEAGTELLFCGEDSVISVNLGTTALPTRALKATLTQKDIDLTAAGYVDGWMTLATPGNPSNAAGTTTLGLPTLGGAFFKAAAGTATFGVYFPHRFTR